MEEIPHVDLDVTPTDYKMEILPILKKIRQNWKDDEIVFKELPKGATSGLLNTMVRCYSNQHPDDVIMIRIVNNTMSQFLDRNTEVTCLKYLHKHDCAPQILATFKTGFCYQFIHGEVLSCPKLKEEPIWRCLANELAKIHAAKVDDIPDFSKEIKYKTIIDQLLQGYPEAMTDPDKNERFKKYLPKKETAKREMYEAWDDAVSFQTESDLVLTHNDARAENVVWDEKTGKAKFVDFEAAGYNYRGSELAAHFQKFAGVERVNYSMVPDQEFQLKWLRVYLQKYYQETGRRASDVTDKDVRRLYVQTRKFELIHLLLSVLAGPLFDEMGVIPDKTLDIVGNAIDAYQRYHKLKDEIFALQLPKD